MLVFATEIPVREDRTVEDLLTVVRAWILGSPHTKFTPATFPPMPAIGDEVTAVAAGDKVVVVRATTANGEHLGAVQYLQAEVDGVQWSTEVVGARTEMAFTVGVRVSCEAITPVPSLPPPKTPLVLRMLLERLGGGQDGDLDLMDRPWRLEAADVETAARAVNGDLGNSLPIVYVSAPDTGDYLVSPERAARDWSGLAHVLVEPDRAFSFRLRLEADAQNAYAGAVGIYWPEGAGRRVLLMGPRVATPEIAERAVLDELRTALANRRPSRACTWSNVQEALSHARYTRLKQQGSTQVEEYVTAFDGELRAKNAAIESAEAEIARLRAEVRRLEALIRQDSGGGLLAAGVERDLYPRERVSIAVEALKDARTRVADEGRRAHILDDLLRHNDASDVATTLKDELRGLLREYRSMSPRLRGDLEALGFSLTDDGKHIKMVFRGDPRYTFTMPKTPGDFRSGLNMASQIARTLF